MDESILTSIKRLVSGIPEEQTFFDDMFISHINSVFSILWQLGIGNDEFYITDKEQTWGDYLSNNSNLRLVKSYVALKVRLLFDPPTISTVTEAINNQISEMEFRLNVMADNKEK